MRTRPQRYAIWMTAFTMMIASASPSAAQDDVSAAIAELRQVLESQFRASVGIGFLSFDCDLGPEVARRGYFFCHAVDEEGDRFRYQILMDNENPPEVALVLQPAAQLPADTRDALEPPCREFLKEYNDEAWGPLHAALHRNLQEIITLDGARERLEPVRQALGAATTVELDSYGYRTSGRHELEYRIGGRGGGGLFRCGLAFDDQGTARVIAFLVTAQPGSALQASMLRPVARQRVAELTQTSVVSIEAPLEELAEPGDVIEGTASLASGEVLAIRGEYRGDPYDFEPVDFAFQVLDIPFLVRRHFGSQNRTVVSIECPTPVAADGTSITCETVLDGDERLLVTVARRGGNHRMLAVEPADPS